MKVLYRHKQYWINGNGRRITPHVIQLCEKDGRFFLEGAEIGTTDDGNDEPIYGTFEVCPEQAFAFASEVGCLDCKIAAAMMGVPEDTQWTPEYRRITK